MLALVDANYKFMYVDVGAYGADSDGGIFRECGLYQQDTAGVPPSESLPGGDTDVLYFLVGDDTFAIRSWMMKPHSQGSSRLIWCAKCKNKLSYFDMFFYTFNLYMSLYYKLKICTKHLLNVCNIY